MATSEYITPASSPPISTSKKNSMLGFPFAAQGALAACTQAVVVDCRDS
ncbi:hypothetical protein ACE0DR_20780 [Azotobacter sp. CWF10]